MIPFGKMEDFLEDEFMPGFRLPTKNDHDLFITCHLALIIHKETKHS